MAEAAFRKCNTFFSRKSGRAVKDVKHNINIQKMIIGYTTGVYDLFHIGHLTLLKNAKGLCDKLIVGVTVDELVLYKGKKAMIPYSDRAEIVRSIKYVDAVVPQYDMDKLVACKKLGATVLFVGDDWYGTEKWKKYEEEFAKEGIKIIYFPYTKGISSTKITEALKHTRGWADGKEIGVTEEEHLSK
jgi:glycerol-3-phosphate cytidylyltransferase